MEFQGVNPRPRFTMDDLKGAFSLPRLHWQHCRDVENKDVTATALSTLGHSLFYVGITAFLVSQELVAFPTSVYHKYLGSGH